MPPSAHGVKVISIGMFTKGNAPVVWRGPMLHRALQQFLADVFWGDLDVLLLDLPPGTGDIAISLAQMLPTAELLVVTTPQLAAAEVAEQGPAPWSCRPISASPGSLRTCRTWSARTAGSTRHLRLRRRPDRRHRADPDHRGAGPAARPGADRHPAARGQRRGQAAGAQQPIRTRCRAAQQDRRRPRHPHPQPRREFPATKPPLARPLLYGHHNGLRRDVSYRDQCEPGLQLPFWWGGGKKKSGPVCPQPRTCPCGHYAGEHPAASSLSMRADGGRFLTAQTGQTQSATALVAWADECAEPAYDVLTRPSSSSTAMALRTVYSGRARFPASA